MPRPAVRIELGIRHVGQRAVNRATLTRRREPVDGGADQRMTELHLRAHLQQTGVLQRISGIPRHAEEIGRAPEQDRIAGWLGRGDQQEHPRARAHTLDPTLKAFLQPNPQAPRVVTVERVLRPRGGQPAR